MSGCRLSSVRELAADASVNPNTMQKALSDLEQSGLIYSQRTAGRFVTKDVEMLKISKEELAQKKILDFFQQMQRLGLNQEETLKLIEKTGKEM